MPMRANDSRMPYECFNKVNPDVGHIHTFRCIVGTMLPSKRLGKLDNQWVT